MSHINYDAMNDAKEWLIWNYNQTKYHQFKREYQNRKSIELFFNNPNNPHSEINLHIKIAPQNITITEYFPPTTKKEIKHYKTMDIALFNLERKDREEKEQN